MRFMVDESTGPSVARWLREQGHEVFSVFDQSRGIPDEEVIQKACHGQWILVTNDKDFGEKVYRERHPHKGVILLRLSDERPDTQIATLKHLLSSYEDRLPHNFVVVTETKVRFAKKP
jgi:predicted nuclease of predicted toxin-antitoxin system